ncbi:MAG: hypothetical protein WD066_13470 [Planctomycetaceae bacterium]
MANKHLYRDDRGNRVVLGTHCLGKGGEGAVFSIDGTADWVAKIYSNSVSSEKVAKLVRMTRGSTPELRKFAAWPDRILHESKCGTARGFVMPRIKEVRSIHELYGPAARRQHFPKADWRFLVRTARNCAAAFTTLHDAGIVIGDVNQGNVLVSSEALVTLIDCDSFQVRENGRVHRCPVGVPEFTPPELQGANDFKNVDRTTNHDAFGLAVLIFHLLFMGRHPFAGRFLGTDDMPIPRAIRENRFAYGKHAAQRRMEPPPHALSLDELPDELADLFERAFTSERRPAAREWGTVLEAFEERIGNCRTDPGHVHSTVLRRCPWCRIEEEGGPAFFISVSFAALVGRGATIDLESLWKEIDRLPLPSNDIAVPAPNTATTYPKPLPLPREVSDPLKIAEWERRATELAATISGLDRRVSAIRNEFEEAIRKASRESEERAAAAIKDFEQRHAATIKAFKRRQRRIERKLDFAARCAIGGVSIGLIVLIGGAMGKAAVALLAGILLLVSSAFTWFGLRMRHESLARETAEWRRRMCPEANLIRYEFRMWEQCQQDLLARELRTITIQVEPFRLELSQVGERIGREIENRRAALLVVRNQRANILSKAEERLRAVQDGLRSLFGTVDSDFHKMRQSLEMPRGRANELDRLKAKELQKLRDRAQEVQFDDHLKRCLIARADIRGIGAKRVATLQSYGIETAFDLARLAGRGVPGFGEVLMGSLIAWRQKEERRFRFDPSKGIPQDTRLAVEVKYQRERAMLAAKLKKGLTQLRRITAEARSAATRLISDKARLEQEVAQARADGALAEQAISEIQARLRSVMAR